MTRTIEQIRIVISEEPDTENVELQAFADISTDALGKRPLTLVIMSGTASTLKGNAPYTQEKEIAFKQIIRRLHVLGFSDGEIDTVLEKQMDNEKDAATVS